MMKSVARRWSTLAATVLAVALAGTMSVAGPAAAAPAAPAAATTADSQLYCIPAMGGYFCHISGSPSNPIRWKVNGTPIPAWDDLSAGSGGCGLGWHMLVEVTVGGDPEPLTRSFTCLG